MEDTMDVDDDMRMEEDPAIGELPMSTDEDSNMLARSPIMEKAIDDRMASDSLPHIPSVDNFGITRGGGDGATEMEADSVNSNDLNNTSREDSDNARQAISSTVNADNAVTELSPSSAEHSETAVNSSSIASSIEAPNIPGECVATCWGPEGTAPIENQSNDNDTTRKGDDSEKTSSVVRDPLLDNDGGRSKDVTNENVDDDDPFGESAMEKQLHSDAEVERAGDSKTLTNIDRISQMQEENNKSEEPDAIKRTTEGQGKDGSTATQGNIDDADSIPDHISVDDSSVSEGKPDHVSLDSDSDAEDTGNQRSSKSPQEISSHNMASDNASDNNESTSKGGPQSKSSLTMLSSLNQESLSIESVDCNDKSKQTDNLSDATSTDGAMLGSLLKPSESEMITRDSPKVTADSPSAQTTQITLQSLLSTDFPTHSPVGEVVDSASLKHQYSVKPLSIPVSKTCLHCAQVNQRCSWKVFVAGRDYYICSEKCLKAHRLQRSQMQGSGGPTLSNSIQTSDTSTIFRKCAFCAATISKRQLESLTWEVMEFCNESCLSSYQTTFTANCCNCKTSVNSLSMGKYSVRFGHEVKQFCSPACLDTFKKGVKTCSFCQKNLQDSTEGFLAAVGGKDQFRDFCSQECLEKYVCICNKKAVSYSIENCVVCDNVKVVQYEVIFFDKVAKLCTDVCLAAYKFVNNIEVGMCGMCHKYYDKNSVSECVTFENDMPTTFCSKHCLNISVLSKRKIVPCACCKAKKYNFDMVYKKGANNDDGLFVCSVNCLSMYGVSSHIVPTKSPCAQCKKVELSSFHITMSDGTIRHFCCYDCVVAFQQNFATSLPQANIPVPAGAPKRITLPVEENSVNTSSSTSGGLTIHSVSSLSAPTPQPTTPAPSTNVNRVKHHHQTTKTTIKIPSSFTLNSYEMKNKWTQINIRSKVKSVMCYPQKKEKDTQCSNELINGGESSSVNTGAQSLENSETALNNTSSIRLIPIPVPIYVPYPAPMYTLPSPIPIPIPVPIVVPLLVPSNADAFKEILERCNPSLDSGNDNTSSEKVPASDTDEPLPQDTSTNLEGLEDVEHRKFGRKRDHEEGNFENPEPAKKARLDSTYVVACDDPPVKKLKLKYMLGVNTWKNFVKCWNESPDIEEGSSLKSQLLSMRPCELDSSLALFLRKASRRNGEEYQPDLKFYLSLGIQYYLFDSGRTDHIFGDIVFEEFTNALNEDAKKFLCGSDDAVVSRVEEEHLWECMQLGANSPQVLMMTLMYYITLRCNLWTVDEHMRLTFDSFQKVNEVNSKSNGDESEDDKIVKITLNSTKEGETNVIERTLFENKIDRTRCPVRFYEFYITKCPEVALQRNLSFYLKPESSCLPESPIWYKSCALPVYVIEKMLNRVKMIKEICEARQKSSDTPVTDN